MNVERAATTHTRAALLLRAIDAVHANLVMMQRPMRVACSESVNAGLRVPGASFAVQLVGATRYGRHSQSHTPRLPRCVR